MQRHLVAAAVVAMFVGGCSDKGADADGDGKISDSEAKAELAKGGSLEMMPGEWEVRVSIDSTEGSNISAEQAKAAKARAAAIPPLKTCITQEQVEKPGAEFFGAPAEANCTFNALQRSGNSMKVTMNCKPMANMTIESSMNGTFAKESYTMSLDQKANGPMGSITTKGKIEGRRIGDCPA